MLVVELAATVMPAAALKCLETVKVCWLPSPSGDQARVNIVLAPSSVVSLSSADTSETTKGDETTP